VSGIFGMLHDDGKPVDMTHLDTLKQGLRHRGPDGSGLFSEGMIGLGHLATHITPESVHERLPYAQGDKGPVITADARIDNRDELFDRLGIHESERCGTPDSQLILKAYETWGEDCPRYLVGEFAFAIWSRETRTLFCARDHMGFRSLFYCKTPGRFVFSSEIMPILALPFVRPELEVWALARALVKMPGMPDGELSFFKGVLELRMGCSLTVRAGSDDIKIRSYWDPLDAPRPSCSSAAEYAEALKELVFEATVCRLRRLPDVKAGVMLSGGLDSSALACIAARKLAERGDSLVAVSSVLRLDHGGIEKDERPYIQTVLDQEPNIVSHFVTADGVGPFDGLEGFFQETGMTVSAYHYMDDALKQTARDQGVRLLLCGLGGDHMASYSGKDVWDRLVPGLMWGKAVRLAREIAAVENRSALLVLARGFLSPLRTGLRKRNNPDGLALSAINPEFLKRLGINPQDLGKFTRPPNHASAIMDKITRGKFAVGMENIRNARYDITGLYPYFDKRIVEFFLQVPAEHFMAGGRSRGLFRLTMEGILPPSIQWRKDKQPYSPDFHRRLMNNRSSVLALLRTIASDDPVRDYLDIDRIRAYLERARPVAGWADWDKVGMGVVFGGVQLIRFLRWFESGRKNDLLPDECV